MQVFCEVQGECFHFSPVNANFPEKKHLQKKVLENYVELPGTSWLNKRAEFCVGADFAEMKIILFKAFRQHRTSESPESLKCHILEKLSLY